MDILDLIYIVSFFLIGTLVGSFLSLAIHRLPRKEDIMVKRSYCPNCGHRLEFLDLIPVLSYVFLGGKCRYCGQGIRARYLLLELANGAFFSLMYIVFDSPLFAGLFLLFYTIVFVFVGSYYNSLSLYEKESFEVLENDVKKDIKKNKNVKIKKKDSVKKKVKKNSGFINAELAVATFIAFVVLAVVIVILYNSNVEYVSIKKYSGAIELAVREIEQQQIIDYAEVLSYPPTVIEFDGSTYTRGLKVENYTDSNPTAQDIVKRIEVIVSYKIDDEIKSVNFKDVVIHGEVPHD